MLSFNYVALSASSKMSRHHDILQVSLDLVVYIPSFPTILYLVTPSWSFTDIRPTRPTRPTISFASNQYPWRLPAFV